MNGYWGKYLGAAICVGAILGFSLILLEKHELLQLVIPSEIQFPVLELIFAFGLFILTFSKEKVDDEQIQRVRYTAQRAGLFISFLAAFQFLFVNLLTLRKDGSSIIDVDHLSHLILFLLIIPLLIYQIIFQIGVFFDPGWVHSDRTAEDNLRENPVFRYFLIGIHVAGIIVLIMALILKK